ncbi:unnamed protein product [Citrullus colocynthis]|uniref:Uncharacterized protein n=1 Tax=Citrullus colocynthis TaxID=252529 RepID=A0ABP0Z0W1_9ROSI
MGNCRVHWNNMILPLSFTRRVSTLAVGSISSLPPSTLIPHPQSLVSISLLSPPPFLCRKGFFPEPILIDFPFRCFSFPCFSVGSRGFLLSAIQISII